MRKKVKNLLDLTSLKLFELEPPREVSIFALFERYGNRKKQLPSS